MRLLKKALLEYYRFLEILKAYKLLNYFGFVKIMKKFDKKRHVACSCNFIRIVEAKNMCKSKTIDALMCNVEAIFQTAFAKGSRQLAMKQLRLPNHALKTHHFTAFRAGISGGCSLVLLVQSYALAFGNASPAGELFRVHLFPIYTGILSMLLNFWLFGAATVVWTAYKINYKFIFEFDMRRNLNVAQYFDIVATVTLAFAATFFVAVTFADRAATVAAMVRFPLCFLGGGFLMLALPMRVWYASARFWLLSTVGRIVTTPYYAVHFRDFFVADQMLSTLPLFRGIGALVALLLPLRTAADVTHWKSVLAVGVAFFPVLWRTVQCYRRYFDNRVVFPHLVNGVKFSVNLCAFLATGYCQSVDARFNGVFPAIVALILLSTLFNAFWDIIFDFGFFHSTAPAADVPSKRVLRDKMIYNNVAVSDCVFICM